jgi:hypothetical protein
MTRKRKKHLRKAFLTPLLLRHPPIPGRGREDEQIILKKLELVMKRRK